MRAGATGDIDEAAIPTLWAWREYLSASLHQADSCGFNWRRPLGHILMYHLATEE